MQLFSAEAIVFSKKLKKKFFDPEKVKKRASKVAHNRPRPFFPTVQPRPQPRIDFSYYEISGPDICSLICDLLLLKKINVLKVSKLRPAQYVVGYQLSVSNFDSPLKKLQIETDSFLLLKQDLYKFYPATPFNGFDAN